MYAHYYMLGGSSCPPQPSHIHPCSVLLMRFCVDAGNTKDYTIIHDDLCRWCLSRESIENIVLHLDECVWWMTMEVVFRLLLYFEYIFLFFLWQTEVSHQAVYWGWKLSTGLDWNKLKKSYENTLWIYFDNIENQKLDNKSCFWGELKR